MRIGRWEGNEIIYTVDVVENSIDLMESFDFATDILGDNMIVSGMSVSEAGVPDMTVQIEAGIAKDDTVGTFLIGEALIGIITASHATLDRRDIIEVRRFIEDTTPLTRQFKDPVTKAISSSTIDTKTEYKTEIKVLAGTPGTGVALAVESGWIKIAEILVPAASVSVVDANIYNVDAEKIGANNTSWTTDITSIYRNGSISDMKTKIVDNKAYVDNTDFLPIGTIIMFDANNVSGGAGNSGAWVDNSTLPGWFACIAGNSVQSCPDLVDKFVMGKVVAGVAATGGNNTHTISSAELPVHTHNADHNHTGTFSGNSHIHTMPTHNHSVNTINLSLTGDSAGTFKTSGATSVKGMGGLYTNNTTGMVAVNTDGNGNILIVAKDPGDTNSATQTGSITINTKTMDTGDGGFANDTIDTKPAFYSIIYIRKCL